MRLLYLLLLALIAILLQRYSTVHCLDGIKYDLQPEKTIVECGEMFELKTTVTNLKRFPVLFLRLCEAIPRKMYVDTTGTNVERKHRLDYTVTDYDEVSQTVYLMPRQKLSRSLHGSLPARGRYFFRNTTLIAGDLLGLHESTDQVSYFKEVVVLPERANTPELDCALGSYMGDLSVRRFILADPILTMGFRDYTGREPQKDISWPATLRRGELMVKQYDYTAEITATVLLNIVDGSEADVERCYSLARSVCEKLEEKHIGYSFLTNAPCSDAVGRWNFIGDGLGPRHLSVILEGLGRATCTPADNFDMLLAQMEKEQNSTRSFILVTPELSPENAAALHRYEARRGQKVMVICGKAEEDAK